MAVTATTQRSAWVTLPTLLGVLVVGGVIGAELAYRFVPRSMLASFLGLLTLPLAFGAGMYRWLGVEALLAALEWCNRVARGEVFRGELRDPTEAIPAGSIAFVPAGAAVMGGSGVVMSMLGSSLGFMSTVFLYGAVGALFGGLCTWLVRSGYLPFPEGLS